jgi:hypothetical protein
MGPQGRRLDGKMAGKLQEAPIMRIYGLFGSSFLIGRQTIYAHFAYRFGANYKVECAAID